MAEEKKHAVITPEMVERARSRIGERWLPRQDPYHNTQASRDTIRHFCNGIGDTNPLYRSPKYAKNTRYGRVLAPPCFLYSILWPGGQGGSMPGIHAWHSGNDWEWHRPIFEGDDIRYVMVPSDLVEKQSRMARRTFISYENVYYMNQSDEVIAKAVGWAVWAERGASGEQGKYLHIDKASYTPEQVKKIYDDIDNEEIRGANARYWGDVEVGEEMAPVVKGPLSPRDMNAWLMGGGSPYMRAHEIFVAYQKRHPAVGMVDSTSGQIDVPELVHMEDSRAQEIGIPGAYDYGCQRMSWLGHVLTNWMGDDGFLWKMYGELRLFNVIGDTHWIKGKVTRKYIEGGKCCVDVDCWGENQRGDTTMPGHGTIILPSREHGPVVYPEPCEAPEELKAFSWDQILS